MFFISSFKTENAIQIKIKLNNEMSKIEFRQHLNEQEKKRFADLCNQYKLFELQKINILNKCFNNIRFGDLFKMKKNQKHLVYEIEFASSLISVIKNKEYPHIPHFHQFKITTEFIEEYNKNKEKINDLRLKE